MRSDVSRTNYDRHAQPSLIKPSGGARRDRTDDLMLAKHALSQLSYGPVTRRRMLNQPAFACSAPARQPPFKKAGRAKAAKQRRLVGLGRLELPTSRLSSARSNQLSYKPPTPSPWKRIEALHAHSRRHAPDAIAQTLSPWRVFVREERETKTAKSRLWSSTILKLLAPECF
jgi:hypothetical protein